jgi:hypothetical protein
MPFLRNSNNQLNIGYKYDVPTGLGIFLMGLGKTEKPAHLAKKLLQIREKLSFSQTQMYAAIQNQNGKITIYRGYIAQYEAGRVPGALMPG